MLSRYEIKGVLSFATLDNYETGCYGESINKYVENYTQSAGTLTELVKLLAYDFNCEIDEIQLNACDDLGRIDIQCYQLKHDSICKPSKNTIAEWHAGKRDIYFVNYSFIVERVQRQFDLDAQLRIEAENAN